MGMHCRMIRAVFYIHENSRFPIFGAFQRIFCVFFPERSRLWYVAFRGFFGAGGGGVRHVLR